MPKGLDLFGRPLRIPLSPFFSYYGSKYNLGEDYPPPKYDIIIEPFAGSACYSCLYSHKRVFLIDKNPIVVILWQYLIGSSFDDIMALPLLKEGEKVKNLKICDEAKILLGFCVGTCTTAPRQSATVQSIWNRSTRLRIAKQVKFIKHWEVYRGDYRICPDDVKATWFIDPPYQERGIHYPYSSKYINYKKLSEWCKTRPGQVIVCENKGADWLPFSHFYDVASTVAGRTNHEVMWYSEN